MSQKTAVIFAGVDALDIAEHRQNILSIPQVCRRIHEAEAILRDLGVPNPALRNVLQSSDADFFSMDLFARVQACLAVQVGLFDLYTERYSRPLYFAACSLGDSARLVTSGAAAFKDVIRANFLFGTAAQEISNGALVRVRTTQLLTEDEFASLHEFDLSVAVHQTPRHFLVAGHVADLHRWSKSLDRKIEYVKPLYNYPLHSKLMQPAYEKVLAVFKDREALTWQGQIISSTLKKVINTTEDLREDSTTNMIGAVRWWQTYQWMINDLGIEKVVNIGPTPTLLLFAERIPVNKQPTFFDVMSELSQPGQSVGLTQASQT